MTVLPTTREALVVKTSGHDKRGRVTELPTTVENVFLSVFTFHRPKTWSAQVPTYVSTVMGVRHLPRDPGSFFSSTLSAPMSSRTVANTDAGARFSAKALDAAHEKAVQKVLAWVDAGETAALDAVLAETPER